MKTRNLTVESLVSIAMLFCLLITGCATVPATTEATVAPEEQTQSPTPQEETEPMEEPEEPVVLRVGWLEAVDCFNPFSCQWIWDFGDFNYDLFIGKGATPDCDAVPSRMLDSWELSDDGLSWTLKLHEGITFSDGTPFDAEAAADFLQWYSTHDELQYWWPSTEVFDSVEVVDDLTVRYNTTQPAPSFARADAKFLYVVPHYIWEDVPLDEIYTYELYPPIGTGPYTLTEHEQGSHLVLDAREDFYRGKPPIDRIVVQYYTNADALVNAVISGEVDITWAHMPPESYDVLDSDPNLTLYVHDAARKFVMAFNMAEGGIKHPAVEDISVREAFDYAIDKQQLVDVGLLGHGSLCATGWACPPNMMDEINPDLDVTPYDPTRAAEILDEAGYLDTDDDGVRETPDGEPLEFRLFYLIEEAPLLTIADLIKTYMEQVGISIEVEAIEYGQSYSQVLDQRDFDIMLYNNYTDVNAAEHLKYSLTCFAAEAGSAFANYPGYCNEDLDDLVWGASYLSGEEYTEAIYSAQEIVNQEKPYIFLVSFPKIQAYRHDRFDFPEMGCHEYEGGLVTYEGIMNVQPK